MIDLIGIGTDATAGAEADSCTNAKAFSKRVANHWSDEVTGIVNDIEGDTLEDRRLKILEVVPCFDH